VFFYDDNFLAKRSRSLELLDEMISKNLAPSWTAQARRETGTDRELAGLMKKAKCRNVCVGYESVDAERLEQLGKGETVSFEESLYGFHSAGLRVHGMFMLDKKTDYSLVEKMGLDFLQVTITTPVPGTELFEKTLENELFIDELNPVKDGDSWRNWKYFDGGHIVTKDPCGEGRVLSPEELAAEQERFVGIFRDFYTFRKAFAKNRTLNERQFLKNLFFWYVAMRAEREQRTFVSKLRNLGKTTKKLLLPGEPLSLN
ncbi:hypothetical protein JW707_01890, partial [Candidatus Woesearchaeota archaeon]|nr:hypothetical protein [Candidatus Woesearchaeota archaeon]